MTEDAVRHFGVKGMKWGVRKQKELDSLNRIAAGKGKTAETILLVANTGLPELLARKGSPRKIAAGRAAILQAQKKRIESGDSTKLDRINRALNTSLIDLIQNR